MESFDERRRRIDAMLAELEQRNAEFCLWISIGTVPERYRPLPPEEKIN